MSTKFDDRLQATREAGQVAAKRRGQSVKAITLRQLDAGADDPVDIWRAVLEERGELPHWLADAPKHELAAALAAWGSVKHTMRQNKPPALDAFDDPAMQTHFGEDGTK